MESLISIIVPVYNSELYLDKCITSIINQTYTNIEIILVDDGSTDSSYQICEKYAAMDHRIKVVHKKNGGLSSARNAGLDVCSGDYIGFVDSDDWVSATMYETLLAICNDQKTIATIGMEEVNLEGEIFNKSVFENQVTSRDHLLRSILCRQDFGSVCSRLFPREMIIEKRFDETKLNEDILFMILIMQNIESASYSSKCGYYYFRRDGSISRRFGKAIHDMIGNSEYVRKKVEEQFPKHIIEAEYYELYQHMSFLLCCPPDYERSTDLLYKDVLSYVRKHIFVAIRNQYFTWKNKIVFVGVSLFPKTMSKLYEKKHRKRKIKA